LKLSFSSWRFQDDLAAPFEVRRGARAAGRADDHRDAGFHAVRDHVAQVALDAGAVGEGLAGAEVVRAGIGRAAVDGDQIRLFGHAAQEARFREAVAEDGGRGKNLEFGFHGQVLRAFNSARVRCISLWTMFMPSSKPMPGLTSMRIGRAASARCTQVRAETSVSLQVPP
jgi:hypothetical protein